MNQQLKLCTVCILSTVCIVCICIVARVVYAYGTGTAVLARNYYSKYSLSCCLLPPRFRASSDKEFLHHDVLRSTKTMDTI